MHSMISYEHYFDWAATSPQDESIAKEALQCSIEHWANPSSIHDAGKDSRNALEESRKVCAKALNVDSSTIYFTSGGTESDHLVVTSVLSRPFKGSIIISAIEHPAIREICKMMTNTGWKIITVNPNNQGIITSQAIKEKLEDDTMLVCIMAVNNETGAIQPIYEIADMLEEATKGKRKPFFMVDCVQAAGKIPLNLNHKGIDGASFSAHKICGPRGIGILYLKKELQMFLKGGGQEKNIRSGTENLFGAKAFSLCLEKYFISDKNQNAMQRFEMQKEYTKEFISKLETISNCVLIPYCRSELSDEVQKNYSPWVVQASFKGIPGQVMERALSSKGFYISTGSACSAGSHARPILDTMGISKDEKESAVRFSFGALTTKKAMDELFDAVKEVCQLFNH